MIYFNKNSSTPAQKKIGLENSLQQSFATLSKLLIFRLSMCKFFLKEELKIEFWY